MPLAYLAFDRIEAESRTGVTRESIRELPPLATSPLGNEAKHPTPQM